MASEKSDNGKRVMGINTHVYTVYGVRLEWDQEFYDVYEELDEKRIPNPRLWRQRLWQPNSLLSFHG